jgi:hypothetical protein
MNKIAYKLLGKNYDLLARDYFQMKTYLQSIILPYKFDAHRYSDSFLSEIDDSNYDEGEYINKDIDKVIYVFWTGDNAITPNRLAGIKSLKTVSGVDVKLITPSNLDGYIKIEDPLPESFQYLSCVHKADYLRSYFMHHYGGGYADIKTYYKSWLPAFSSLDNSDAYIIGYPEVGYWGAANVNIPDVNLRRDLRIYWRLLIGNGAFICRPHTKLTAEWHGEAKRRLLYYSDELKAHPAKDIFGTNLDYPIHWAEMQGEVFHPLCLKYRDKLLKNKNLKPSFENYR